MIVFSFPEIFYIHLHVFILLAYQMKVTLTYLASRLILGRPLEELRRSENVVKCR